MVEAEQGSPALLKRRYMCNTTMRGMTDFWEVDKSGANTATVIYQII